ncbi:hypothetical protein [Nocardia sp. R6R-6]|uniref:hypothetical protein n=1 Tax=Nocardia sp. R6R-6 TaxID=3459303 RepID=UPI00403E22E6
MFAQQRLRTMIVVLFGTPIVALGSVTVLAPEAAAAPTDPPVTQVSGYHFDFGGQRNSNPFDFDGRGNNGLTGQNMFSDGDRTGKAEKLGGNLTTKLIDLVAGMIKCGLNITTPSVKCSL